MRRFYAPRKDFKNNIILLNAEETRHLKNVLRLSEGDEISVFDGEGNEFLCEIKNIDKKQTSLQIVKEISTNSNESNLDLTLAVVILKGDKFDLVIQKSVELGVIKFVPIITKRCDVKLRNEEKKLERWRKIIIEASKQTGRAKLMEITEPFEFEDFVEDANGTKILFSERDGKSFSEIKSNKTMTAVIGSEGGWEDSEIELAKKNGFQIITFGGRILRAETAVISIAAILQHRFGDLI
ncbi:MAG: 16S rRNA (uracil(1498)-N(3))-methyltransferase [Acidobacteriota bacterium]|jgi:16S rRNA (uracil1498-N3)-methyltransferase|nr:16S rRNA (uracil(1498)-N(3))-methyltransferase [Acidobacteriota bacterium]